VFRLDRVLSSAVYYNFDYGFIEGTRAGDGDHTDALLIIDEPTFTGCHVWARPIGGLEMRDEKGFDFKVLCVAIGDAHQQHIERLEQVRPHRLVEIEHFFETYKALEDKAVDVVGWRDNERALEVLREDRKAWVHEMGERPG
jgi:inorganic pyrophosphatase